MSARDYYSVLGVARGADADEIQRAYRKLAKKYHPDVSKEPNAEQRFKEVGEAYEVLKDTEKRSLYDQWGHNWEAVKDGRAAPPGAGGFDFSNFGGAGQGDLNSIFEQMFGGGAGRRARRRRPPAAQETPIELGVSQAYEGGRREITFRDAAGERRRLTVGIPKGVRDGQKIRLAGQASTGGDLFLVVKLVKDAQFDVRGHDLVTKVRIPAWDAVLGTSASVPTLDGEVRIKVPAGSSSGRQIRLRERGYPKKGGGRGDLYAELSVTVPEDIDEAQRVLWEQLRDLGSSDE